MKHLPLIVMTLCALCASFWGTVTASAKQSPPSTAYNLSQIGKAALLYAGDYDNLTVLTKQGDQGTEMPWARLIMPLLDQQVKGNQQPLFFDPTRPDIKAPMVQFSATAQLPWYQLTTIAINDAGYTGYWSTVGGKCTGRKIVYVYSGRNLSAMENPAQRVAFSPVMYDTLKGRESYGWYFFHSYDAPFPKEAIPSTIFSWNNMVYGTRKLYKDGIPVVRADGSAATLQPANFNPNASTPAQQCAFLASDKTFGDFWQPN